MDFKLGHYRVFQHARPVTELEVNGEQLERGRYV